MRPADNATWLHAHNRHAGSCHCSEGYADSSIEQSHPDPVHLRLFRGRQWVAIRGYNFGILLIGRHSF